MLGDNVHTHIVASGEDTSANWARGESAMHVKVMVELSTGFEQSTTNLAVEQSL